MACWKYGLLGGRNNARQEQYSRSLFLEPHDSLTSQAGPPPRWRADDYSKRNPGFTLLEVMIAISIIAITLVTVFGSQSQSLSLANEAKFSTTAALLAQSKMAEIEAMDLENLASDSGDFGEGFPNYHWHLTVSDVSFVDVYEILGYLKRIDLSLFYGENSQYQYNLRLYRFAPGIE